jgi:predicted RNase H-like HicB family nuclease
MDYRLSIEIELLKEGVYLASCPAIQGCHAEGRTIGEALDNLQSVAKVIHELCREKGLPFITEFPDASIEKVIWQVEFSTALEVTR